jgi:hypothetical protein
MTQRNPPFDAGDSLFEPQSIRATATVGNASPVPTQTPAMPLPLVQSAVFEFVENQLRDARPVERYMTLFLEQELDVSRLNRMHKHLWAAGLPHAPRALHKQLEIGREIRITERADMHMLWTGLTIYLKPLPDFLLSFQIWKDVLCKDVKLHAEALGFLRSYVWLIIYPSDYKIAVARGLLNDAITWEKWSNFISTLVNNGVIQAEVNPRYHFGELRLFRVHWIFRLCSKARLPGDSFIRGYYYRYYDYSSFVNQYLAWLLTAFLYVAIVLTAMQVGLATKRLDRSPMFLAVSWGFAVFSILSPLAIVFLVSFCAGFLVVMNWIFASKKKGRPTLNHPVWNNVALIGWKH